MKINLNLSRCNKITNEGIKYLSNIESGLNTYKCK